MAGKPNEKDTPLGVLTKEGQFDANNAILDLLRPKGKGQEGYRKDAVTFIRDPKNGDIREIGTGRTYPVRYLKQDR